MDYIKWFTYFIVVGVFAVVAKKIWDMITGKEGGKKKKWEQHMEED